MQPKFTKHRVQAISGTLFGTQQGARHFLQKCRSSFVHGRAGKGENGPVDLEHLYIFGRVYQKKKKHIHTLIGQSVRWRVMNEQKNSLQLLYIYFAFSVTSPLWTGIDIACQCYNNVAIVAGSASLQTLYLTGVCLPIDWFPIIVGFILMSEIFRFTNRDWHRQQS